MPAPKNNNYAEGHDGSNAGRRSFRDETVINAVIGKMWGWLDKNFERFDEKQKMECVLRLCPKTIPEHHDHGGEVKLIIVDKVNAGDNSLQLQPDKQEISGGDLG